MGLGLPDVRVRLTAEGEAQVVNALRKVVSESQRAGRQANKGFAQFNSALLGARNLLGQIAAAASVGAFVAIAKNAADAADEVGKMSQRVGASVQNLSALSLVAKTAGVDLGELTRTLVFLGRRVAELQGGSKDAQRDFGALGLTVRDFKGKDAAQQLDVVAAAFAKLEDSPQKTALGFRIFGKQVAEILPLLSSLAGDGGLAGAITRARELGVLLSEDTARAAQAINDDLTVIKEQVLAGAARFVEGFAPAVHAVLGDVQKDLGKNQDAWKTWGESVGQTVGLLVLTVGSLIDRIIVSLQKLGNAGVAVAKILTTAVQTPLALGGIIVAEERLAREANDRLEAEFQKREQERRQRAENLGFAIGRGAAGLPALRPAAGTADAPVIADDAERKRREAEAKRLAAEQKRLEAERQKRQFAADTAASEQALAALGRERADIEQRVALGLLSQAEGAKRVADANREALPTLQAIYKSYVLIAAANPFDVEAQNRVAEFGAKVREVETAVEAVDSTLQQVAVTAKDALKDALVDALTSGLQEARNLLDALRNVALAVVQAVQQLLALKLAESIVSAIPGFSGGGPVRRATGGVVSGPGTGTSDSVPALLSHGEYVVRAAVVQQPGMLAALDAVNRGIATPALAGPRGVRRFADGGFVSGAGVAGPDVNVNIGLEEGLVARQIESPQGSRAVVRVLAKNRRAAGSALGG